MNIVSVLPSDTAYVRIFITDVNDNAPAFAQPVYEVSVEEDKEVGFVLITVTANDEDEGESQRNDVMTDGTLSLLFSVSFFFVPYSLSSSSSSSSSSPSPLFSLPSICISSSVLFMFSCYVSSTALLCSCPFSFILSNPHFPFLSSPASSLLLSCLLSPSLSSSPASSLLLSCLLSPPRCHSSLASAVAPLRSTVLMFVSLFVFVPLPPPL